MWYLTKYKKQKTKMDKHLYAIERHMGGTRTLRMTRVTPSSIQKYFFIM